MTKTDSPELRRAEAIKRIKAACPHEYTPHSDSWRKCYVCGLPPVNPIHNVSVESSSPSVESAAPERLWLKKEANKKVTWRSSPDGSGNDVAYVRADLVPGQQWQGIETAPKDDGAILLLRSWAACMGNRPSDWQRIAANLLTDTQALLRDEAARAESFFNSHQPTDSPQECLMADCHNPQEHFCFKHCVEIYAGGLVGISEVINLCKQKAETWGDPLTSDAVKELIGEIHSLPASHQPQEDKQQ
jgi:hypothetical protein